MATYRTQMLGRFDSGSVVGVQTDKTFYRVAETKEEVTVVGPGVEEIYTIGEEIPYGLSLEAKALLAVLLWEDQL
jgi:hypothetical protein